MKFFLFAVFLVTATYAELDSLMSSGEEKNAKALDSSDRILPVNEQFSPPAPSLPLAAGKLKAAAAIPVKTIATKVAVTKLAAAPKLKAAAAVPMKAALKKKPKVHSLKPIVYVVEKPVTVYHRVPVPKKVLVPKFYPVYKKVPVPKIIPVPVKFPVKKIIPKIVKIPKAIPVPKIVPMKKPVPVAIPYPVFKTHKVPVPKPVPYAKYIPIPVKKKVPKFVPVPVKKIIKVPKPYYVPVKVPHFSASYVKAPMSVNVPDVKKHSFGSGKLKHKTSMKGNQNFMSESKQTDSEKLFGSMPSLGKEDDELLKMLTKGGLSRDESIKI